MDLVPSAADRPDHPPSAPDAAWREFARAPLVPVAVAVAAGLLLDRYGGVPFEFALGTAVAGLVTWLALPRSHGSNTAVPLWIACAGLAAAHHHAHRHVFADDDIGFAAAESPRVVRVRATLADDPRTRYADRPTTAGWGPTDRDVVPLRVTALRRADGSWADASGLARFTVDRPTEPSERSRPALEGLRAGDAVEVVGLLAEPRTPSNPGEANTKERLLDQRIRAEIHTSNAPGAVVRLESGRGTYPGGLARTRSSAATALREHLPPKEAGVAAALLLGDGSAMEQAEWDAYIRTGVVHALAISGQHLVVLAGFLWVGVRVAGIRRRQGAWLVLAVIVGYAILTGLRPSGVRAAAMVAAVCGGLIFRRPVVPANAFALSWLVVVAMNPTDPFTLGCKLSFLSTFVLVWGVGRWLVPDRLSPLEQLVESSRSFIEKLLRMVGRTVGIAYVIGLAIWAANAPLLAADQHLVSPVGVLIGPPVVLLTSAALIAGFLLLVLAPLGVVAVPFAEVTRLSLVACEHLVRLAEELPGGSAYVAGPSSWWVVGFYVGLVPLILMGRPWRIRGVVFPIGWILLGVGWPSRAGVPPDELRATFLAVGHGGCTVVETPDGRCLLYDAGSTAGPGVVRRVIAPYLWHRGIDRVDEVFLSHADADHFNGMGELLRRFPVGQVTLTPSFAETDKPEVAATLVALERYGVPRRVAMAGDRFTAGDVEIEVLHPPPRGPGETENERSLVLQLRHAGNTLLLTGDLEKTGTGWVLDQPKRPVDVMMAPHHGSRGAFPERLVAWCEPHLVVVSRGPPSGNTLRSEGAKPPTSWDTYTAGAITLRSHHTGVSAEAFRTGERVVLPRRVP